MHKAFSFAPTKHFFSFVLKICAAFVAALFICSSALAQSEAGSAAIEGTITDANDAVVSGAVVTIRNLETGLERTVVTDNKGNFNAPVLPVGHYRVIAKADGFAEVKRNEVILTVGESTIVNFKLNAAGVSADVTITTESENVDTEETATGTTIPPRSVQELPIRGRNFTEFVQLTPSVVQESDRSGLVIAGQRSINSNVAIDGADFNDSNQGNQRGGNEAVFFFPQTAIKEFQVVRSGATAEVGRTNAGFVNAVTKSGTNDFRGELFYFNRNKTLTSKDAFGRKGNNQQNQFGGSIGGPIRRDKAFFFFGVEQNYLRIPFFVKFGRIPGIALPSELEALEGEKNSTNDPTALFARTDFILNQNNALNVQYQYSRLRGENFGALVDGTAETDDLASSAYQRTGSSHGIKSSLVTTFNANIVNEIRGQVASDFRNEENSAPGPEFRIDGLGSRTGSSDMRFGGSSSRPREFDTLRFQVTDNLSWNLGGHRLRFGFDTNVNKFKGERQGNFQGVWRFSSSGNTTALQNYINRIPRRLDQAIVLLPDALLAEGYQKELAFYIQDRVKLSKELTLTAGLRWEGQWNPTPPNPNPELKETQDIPDDLQMWQPRFGLVWNVGNRDKTVIRASAGLYDARTPSNLFIRVFTNNGIVTRDVRIDEVSGACRTSTTATNCRLRRNPDGTTGSNFIVAFPNLLTPAQANLGTADRQRFFGFQQDFKNPRSFQGSVTVEQQITSEMVLSVGYVRNSTWNLQRRVDRNLFPPTINQFGQPIYPATRPNPNFGIFSVNESSAHSDYNGLVLSLRRRFARRYQFEVNYTLSRTRDDDSNERNFSRETVQNTFDLKAEAGYSKQDVRHNFNASGVFDLGRGFALSGIIIRRSGFPYTPLFQDGTDFNNDGNDANDRAIIDGKVAGRFSLRQPYFFNLDLRLLKAFNFGETKRLSLFAEVFNITRNSNRNFGADSIGSFCTSIQALSGPSIFNVTCPSGTFVAAGAGEAFRAPSTARFGGPRQLQLGVRFTF